MFISLSPPDAPKHPSVTLNPSAVIVEGSSVTLTCSSDAQPAAKYRWSKNRILASKDAQLVLSPVQSSDSGEYDCTAENELGTMSKRVSVDVKCEHNACFSTMWGGSIRPSLHSFQDLGSVSSSVVLNSVMMMFILIHRHYILCSGF